MTARCCKRPITGNPGDAPSREPHLNGIFW
jgi:hypothetical protein